MFNRFKNMWERLGGKSETCHLNFDILNALYSMPNRSYHNLEHIEHCLDEYIVYLDGKQSVAEMEFALWYHDAIYDRLGKRNNEAESALLASQVQSCNELYVAKVTVANMIKATRHGENLEGHYSDHKLIADIDLSILGKPEKDFREYCLKIREEYRQYTDKVYREGRIKVLRMFLNKERIYNTDYFKSKYEAQARTNLEAEIRSLS